MFLTEGTLVTYGQGSLATVLHSDLLLYRDKDVQRCRRHHPWWYELHHFNKSQRPYAPIFLSIVLLCFVIYFPMDP